jgi:elongator complex protein 3
MSIHIMPGLYTSSYKKDLKTFQDIYDDPSIKPDEIKFYPTSVIPNTELHDLYKAGEYKPLETETIKKIIKETFQNIIPPYTRIKRLIRDIPSTEIIAGSSITNLSQLTRQEIRDHIVGSSEAQALYAKLYQNSKLYATLDEYLTHQSHDLDERYKEI